MIRKLAIIVLLVTILCAVYGGSLLFYSLRGMLLNQALLRAAERGDTAAVKTLLKKEVEVNAKESSVGKTALILAAERGHTDTVQALLKGGADIGARDNSGATALFYAAMRGYLSTVKTLLANGADVNAKDEEGFTALIAAARGGYSDVVQALLAAGADVNVREHRWGDTPLQYAKRGRSGRHRKTVAILLKAGAKE
jgi:ankyrin repeat protein